jgi:mRNA interferase RelE/StbE
MSYKVIFTDNAFDNLKKLSDKNSRLLLEKIEQLAQNPLKMRNVKKLVSFSPSYRLRVGKYRVLFERDDSKKVIEIVDVLHRKNAYKRR